jgi:hypothetical protein
MVVVTLCVYGVSQRSGVKVLSWIAAVMGFAYLSVTAFPLLTYHSPSELVGGYALAVCWLSLVYTCFLRQLQGESATERTPRIK